MDDKPKSAYHITDAARQELSATWLLRFARDARYPINQTGIHLVGTFMIGSPTGFHIDVTPIDEHPWITATASDPAEQARVDEMVQQSGERVAHLLERWHAGEATDEDYGGQVWYTTTLTSAPLNAELAGVMVYDRMIELFNRPRILGWRKFGPVLVNFREDESEPAPEQDAVFSRTPIVDLYVPAPGPTDGPFTYSAAHRIIEIAAALCTFALRRPLELSPFVNPIRDDELCADLSAKLVDPQVLSQLRLGVNLDLVFVLALVGDYDSYRRVCAALRTFDAAIRQQSAEVAVILYVAAAECLTNPYQTWKKEKLTKRFVTFYNQLMPDDLDVLVKHNNFEDTFEIRRGNRKPESLRKDLLDQLYGYRSEPVHEGLTASYGPFGSSGVGAMRRLFASYLAELAILRYMASPRTSLVGHPGFDPPQAVENPASGTSSGPAVSDGQGGLFDAEKIRTLTQRSRDELAAYGITVSADHFTRPMIVESNDGASGARTLS
jgi:hypothetical protein